jgi:Tfp pilus assembly PilM family ATPase
MCEWGETSAPRELNVCVVSGLNVGAGGQTTSVFGFFRKPEAVGLDLQDHEIRVVRVKERKITAVGRCPIPAGSVVGGVVNDPMLVGDAIRTLVERASIRTKIVRLSLPSGSTIVKRLGFSKEEAYERPNDFVPSTMNSPSFRLTEDSRPGCIATITDGPVMETRMDACEFAGLEVAQFEAESLAQLRAASGIGDRWADKVTVLIHLSHEKALLTIADGTSFALARSVNHAIGENPDELGREIRRTLNYLQAQSMDIQIRSFQMRFSGDADESLASYLSDRLGVPLVELALPPGLPSSHFEVAYGLAMS